MMPKVSGGVGEVVEGVSSWGWVCPAIGHHGWTGDGGFSSRRRCGLYPARLLMKVILIEG